MNLDDYVPSPKTQLAKDIVYLDEILLRLINCDNQKEELNLNEVYLKTISRIRDFISREGLDSFDFEILQIGSSDLVFNLLVKIRSL